MPVNLGDVELVPLLAAIAHVTGDDGVLDGRLRPDPARLREPQCGYTADQIALAGAAIESAWQGRAAGVGPVHQMDATRLQRIIDFIAGEAVDPRYLALLSEELAVADDPRAPRWHAHDVAPRRRLHALVIGAGMSGIAVAHRLRQAGVDVTLVEKNAEPGGTWVDNTYPGCRVDIQNHMYSYSFAQRNDWPWYFSPQPDLRAYFADCATRFGLHGCTRYRTEVRSAAWDQLAGRWAVHVSGPDGPDVLHAELLISAVGQLNQPKYPDIPGVGSFAGRAFHSARWDHHVELAGARVAVIGTGSSACQFIPHVAREAAQLTVLQRTPPWVIPVPSYQQPVTAAQQWVFDNVPFASQWYRLFLFWRMTEGMLPACIVDPDYPPTERSVSALNELVRQMLQGWIDATTAGDDDLRAKMTPHYPPFAKRCVIDDGAYGAAMRAPNVRLCTDEISAIEPAGVRLATGELVGCDVLIYGTGFQASDFLTPMRVTGRDGIDLHDSWAGDASAYLGIMVPGFPNFMCMYGPNTNIVANGSIIYFSECEAHYVTEIARLVLEADLIGVEPTAAAHARYRQMIDEANRQRTWGYSTVNSWYKTATGRTAQNWPFRVLEYWEQTRAPVLADLAVTPRP